MKLIIGALAICLFTVSCNKEEKKENTVNDERFIFGKEISKERALSDGEFNVAKSICSSLQTKREYFEARGDNELSFIFALSEKSCISDSYSSPVDYSVNLRVTRAADLRFDGPSNTNFSEDILTDVGPDLNSICNDVLNGINVTNVQKSGAIKYQYRFLASTNGSILEIGKFSQNASNIYIPTFIETFAIFSSVAGDREGMVQDRVRVTSCSNGSVQSMRQVLK